MSIGNTGISDIALLLSGAIKLKAHTSGKPPYSYATLITYAIMKHPRKQMTLNEIYTWVMERYPYFKTAGSGWKNSIRHNLSLSKTFVRIPRPINEPGKGAYWTVDLAVLDATMSNQLKPPAHRLPPTREQQLYGASGNNVGIQRYPLAPPGISALSTQSVSSGSFAPGSFAMGMTSSISEMGLVQNAPLPGSSLALRRASLQALPTHGRYQPYPTPTSMGLSGNRPQYPSIDPSSSYAQQILSNFNPFALPMTANIYNGTNGRLQARNPAALSDVSANMGPQSVFPMITTAISSSSIHGPSADVDTQLGKPNAAILRQDSKVAASNIDNYPFVPAPGNPKSQGPTQFNNKLRDDTWLKQQESVRGEAEFTNLTALPTQAYPQVKATPSLPDYLLTSQNTIPGEIHGQKPYRQPNKMDGASDKTVCAEASAQDETTQPQNHANETTSITNNNMTGNDLSAYFTFSET
ncbi:hypothetical protein EV179_002415 [Coemansia sp. RSA 487]|nr:hypothetical protein EV179_002415 [Coemansia sp. RSA 487]